LALRILSSPPPEPEELAARLRAAIEASIAGAAVSVVPRGAGHFEIEVVSAAFAGLSRVKQQQLVYAAIAPLMSGPEAPVHAVDRMVTRTPDAA
jgi:acid stress-induced BolA-like protein IbaG/YrbA